MKPRVSLRYFVTDCRWMLSEVSDENLVSETQDIFHNTSISHIGGDFNTTSHVWDTNINTCFEPFRITNQYPKLPLQAFVMGALLSLNLSFFLIIILRSWTIYIYINQLPLTFFCYLCNYFWSVMLYFCSGFNLSIFWIYFNPCLIHRVWYGIMFITVSF